MSHFLVIIVITPSYFSADLVYVSAGAANKTAFPQLRFVRERIVYPQFSRSTLENDVALIVLQRKFDYSDTVQPISLETEEVGDDVPCVLSGWGDTLYDEPDILQYVETRTVNLEACKIVDKNNQFPVLDSHICALWKDGVGGCSGDSGGALVSNGREIGILSWGSRCGNAHPDVFTRVSTFATWIKDKIEEYAEY